jgi:hypothetical protein
VGIGAWLTASLAIGCGGTTIAREMDSKPDGAASVDASPEGGAMPMADSGDDASIEAGADATSESGPSIGAPDSGADSEASTASDGSDLDAAGCTRVPPPVTPGLFACIQGKCSGQAAACVADCACNNSLSQVFACAAPLGDHPATASVLQCTAPFLGTSYGPTAMLATCWQANGSACPY